MSHIALIKSLSLLVGLLLSVSQTTVNAAAAGNYNIYNYDIAPTFTPDGRLLQVEYASAAAEHSAPIIALQVDQSTLVLMAVKNPESPQNRIIVLPADPDKPKRQICIAMTGILADSLSLVQVALQQAAQYKQQFRTPWTVVQMATALADACQNHAFGGGIRPYGATMLACGFQGTEVIPVLYQTDPSGGLLEITFPMMSDASSNPVNVCWIGGGSSSIQRQIRKRLTASLHATRKNKPQPLQDSLAAAARILMQETSKNDASKRGKSSSVAVSLEVVVLNPAMGCRRLSSKQVRAILNRI